VRCLTSGNDRPDVIVTTREAELPLDPALQTVNSFGIGWTYMPQSMRLQGKKALVTGSDTGIGHEIGLEFARQGADVIFHYVQESDGALAAVEQAKALGRKSVAFQADFDNLDQVFALAKQSIEFLGGINCLVNNAGVTMNRPFLKVTPDQFDKMFHINFRGQYFLTQKIVEDMLQRSGGVICNMSSVHGLQGVPEHSVYAATKGAIISYTRSLAVELAYKGVRVNAIAPGWVTTENYFKCIPGFTKEKAAETGYKAIPLARVGETIDIARLAAFLCSDDAEFIVGQTIVADGGTTALMSLVSDFRKESTNTFGKGYIPGI
jgi:NAD(P)-dependent dehydrogenase (short-subunit alcohol dehydrogenase family)